MSKAKNYVEIGDYYGAYSLGYSLGHCDKDWYLDKGFKEISIEEILSGKVQLSFDELEVGKYYCIVGGAWNGSKIFFTPPFQCVGNDYEQHAIYLGKNNKTFCTSNLKDLSFIEINHETF